MDSWDTLMADMFAAIENGDTEMAHGDADNILICALRFSATRNITREQMEQLIARYEKVAKWYA